MHQAVVITKIFGRGAAVAYGSKVFGTPTSLENASWYNGRFTNRGGGYFAIGKDVTSNSMKCSDHLIYILTQT